MYYEHSQWGPLTLPVIGFLLLVLALTAALGDGHAAAIAISAAGMAVGALVVVAFSRLTVTVDATQVVAAFTWGWPRRVIPLAEIAAVRPVRNSWWYGLGIRLAPNGTWIYNVWGLDAVELELRTGKRFRIGTDDRDGLQAGLESVIGSRPADP